MTSWPLAIALAYLAFGLAACRFEGRRVRRGGPDAITMFVVLFLLQCCASGIAIFGTLAFVDPATPTGNEWFDRIFQATDYLTALVVLGLTVWFLVFFYIGCAVGQLALRHRAPDQAGARAFVLSPRRGRLLVILAGGMALTLWSFYLLGDDIVARYTNLILLRAGYPGIERTALNSNAYALTQTWGWLAVLAMLCSYELKGPGWTFWLCVVFVAGFAVLGVSRRALFLPVLLSYLTVVLFGGKWRLRWVIAGAVPTILLLAFGKEIFAAVAFDQPLDAIGGTYQSWASAVLRAASDFGITIVESLGTMSYLHIGPRFGVDHVLSLAQRFPEGMLGIDIDWPQRMVRISTEAFAGSETQDIPPGLPGQMWLDFALAGPVVWGLAFGFQMSVVQRVFERTARSLQSAAVFVLVVFVVALPLNSGSFDFTFSVDIFALVVALWWCIRVRRVGGDHALPDGPPSTAGDLVHLGDSSKS